LPLSALTYFRALCRHGASSVQVRRKLAPSLAPAQAALVDTRGLLSQLSIGFLHRLKLAGFRAWLSRPFPKLSRRSCPFNHRLDFSSHTPRVRGTLRFTVVNSWRPHDPLVPAGGCHCAATDCVVFSRPGIFPHPRLRAEQRSMADLVAAPIHRTDRLFRDVDQALRRTGDRLFNWGARQPHRSR
jgi:hypothetical protein